MCPIASKWSASLGELVSGSEPIADAPRADRPRRAGDERAPIGCARMPRSASSVPFVVECADVAYPTTRLACPIGSHARGSVPQPVRWANLSQRRGFVLLAFPDKPAHLGITPTLAGSMPDHPDHADLDPPRCPQMQLVPAMNLNPLAVSIRALPTGIWFAVCARVAATSTALHPCGWPHADQAGERGRGDKRPDWL